MTKVIFITQDKQSIEVEGQDGSLMGLAVDNDIPGIEGSCRGVCSCATCHIHLSKEDFELVGAPDDIELDMLELDDNASEYSRLSCQIEVSDKLEGMKFTVANKGI